MKANILLTCCGRKTYLVDIFRASQLCGSIAAADSDPSSTIRHFADHFVHSPPLDDDEAYVAALLNHCRAFGIHAVIPQNDLDLVVLAAHRDRFRSEGVRVLGVPAPVVAAMADKLESSAWLREHGIPTPATQLHTGAPVDFPQIAKSRFGQGSAGLKVCRSAADLSAVPEGSVLQELLVGEEYNLDILRDGAGAVDAVVVKKKLEMRYGSTDKAVSVRDRSLESLGARLGDALELEGSVDVDVIVTSAGPFVIDVNCRVGGGFPFTARFCPSYVDGLLEIAMGRSPSKVAEYPDGMEIHRETRYFEILRG